ncbi:hypothetical protein [Streptomyces sp. SPB074]|uniref:hypothetical protein n=1 Tax=Streptomyces sp. (strain SPB074) TaxID=465543 RepID=UPI00017F0E4D|nr:hypothetical protein [Streptomyces sp. SPB074]
MVDLCEVLLFFSVVPLLYLAPRYTRQKPLRLRGKHTVGWELRRTIPDEGKIDVEWAYDVDEHTRHTVWERGRTIEPARQRGLVFDPENPRRVYFSEQMFRRPARIRAWIWGLGAVALVTAVVTVVGETR